jgi:hypothetical protein
MSELLAEHQLGYSLSSRLLLMPVCLVPACIACSLSALDLLCRDQMLLLDTTHSFPMAPGMVMLVHDIYGSAAALMAQLAAALADRENKNGSQALADALQVSCVGSSKDAGWFQMTVEALAAVHWLEHCRSCHICVLLSIAFAVKHISTVDGYPGHGKLMLHGASNC